MVTTYFYLSDFNNDQLKMWENFLLFCIKNLKLKIIYAQNFAQYDSNLLIKYLLQLDFDNIKINTKNNTNTKNNVKIKPLYNSTGTLISLKIKINDINLNFYDSMLLLPSSLSKLAKTFKLN